MNTNQKTLNEIYWACGFIDGEGNIRWNKNKGTKKENSTRSYGCAALQVAQIDLFVLERLKNALGCGKIYGPYKQRYENGKPYYYYAVTGVKCIEVIKRIKPYLSPIKSKQIEETIKQHEEQQKLPKLGNGIKLKKKLYGKTAKRN